MVRNPAFRRYNYRVLALMIAYAVLLMSTVYLFKHRLLEGPLAFVAAVLPALPIIGMLASIGAYLVEETDEYLRMLMVRQTLWASAFSLSIATVWGFLENFELVEHVESYAVAVLWFAGLGLGALVNRLTFGKGA